MKVFLTSNLNHYEKIDGVKVAKEIDNTNGLVDQLKSKLEGTRGILYVPADASNKDKIDEYSKILFDALKLSGIIFDNYYVLNDMSSEDEVRDRVLKSDLVFLSGGDTFTQMQYFEKINLREILSDYEGVIVGQSAGSINLAEDVYNSPECEEDLKRPCYFKGLGKTNINIEPHFVLDTSNFVSDEMLHRNAMKEESKKRDLYGLPDVSHIFDDGLEQVVYGDCYLLRDDKVYKVGYSGKMGVKSAILCLIELVDNIQDVKDQQEVIDEIMRINDYKNQIASGQYNIEKVRNFIIKIINKYRNKSEVKNFYNSLTGQDIVYSNDYDTLCLLENMIFQYVSKKSVIKEIKKSVKTKEERFR